MCMAATVAATVVETIAIGLDIIYN